MKRDHDSSMFLSGGNLNNGTQCGAAYLNLNNGVSNSNWNIAGRFCGNFQKTRGRGGNNPPVPAMCRDGHTQR